MPRRLLIAFILSLALALGCWLVLPWAGVNVPWWVPILGFAVIAISAALAGMEWPSAEPDEAPQVSDLDPGDESDYHG